jgi:hypothetical protein
VVRSAYLCHNSILQNSTTLPWCVVVINLGHSTGCGICFQRIGETIAPPNSTGLSIEPKLAADPSAALLSQASNPRNRKYASTNCTDKSGHSNNLDDDIKQFHRVRLIVRRASNGNFQFDNSSNAEFALLERRSYSSEPFVRKDIRTTLADVQSTAHISLNLGAFDGQDRRGRVVTSSYGFMIDEPYEPEIFPAHEGIRPRRDRHDFQMYIRKTIN